jgi:hypothetical protein
MKISQPYLLSGFIKVIIRNSNGYKQSRGIVLVSFEPTLAYGILVPMETPLLQTTLSILPPLIERLGQ